MFKNSYFKIALILVLFIAGVWLIFDSPSLQEESLTRQQAVMQSLAPESQAQKGVLWQPDLSASSTEITAVPTEINFQDAAISTEDENSLINRWLRGEIDIEQETGIISQLEADQLQEKALNQPPDPTIQVAQSAPDPQAPAPTGIAFDSIDFTQSGGWVPPDPELAVGSNHIIAVVNASVEIYDKSGATLFGPTSALNLFNNTPCTSGLYDPNVLYDEEWDRWFLAYDQGSYSATGGYCVLASQSNNPTGLWWEYFFPTNSATSWLDFPHAGIGDEFIFMGGDIYDMSGNFLEGRIHAFKKSDLYNGNLVTAVALGLGSSLSTPQPLNLHGWQTGTWPTFGSTHYFLADPYNGINYTLLEWDTTTLTSHGSIAIGTGGYPIDFPQNGGNLIQANDWRPLDFEYRNGYGWTTLTNACNPGSGTVDCITWAQIDLSTSPPNIGPEGFGTYGSNGEFRIFPDLAVNHCNDMSIGYSKSSASMYPSIWYTGRQSGIDPAGLLQPESELKAGEVVYTDPFTAPYRWGDYSGMTIDPDGKTFWYLGEYSKNLAATVRWGTYIGAFSYTGCPDTFVDDDYDTSTPGWDISHFASIQDGIDNARNGGNVFVAPGMYAESATLNKNITVHVQGNISLTGTLTLSSGIFQAPIDVMDIGGDFIRQPANSFHANGGTIIFNGSRTQNLTLNAPTSFDNLIVDLNTTLVETVSMDHATVNGTLTNHGTIRKAQPIMGPALVTFGLVGGSLMIHDDGDGSLISVQIDSIDQNHPQATNAKLKTGRYWVITANAGAAGFVVDMTLPITFTPANDGTDKLCRYTIDPGSLPFTCGQQGDNVGDPGFQTLTRHHVTQFSTWTAGINVIETTVYLPIIISD